MLPEGGGHDDEGLADEVDHPVLDGDVAEQHLGLHGAPAVLLRPDHRLGLNHRGCKRAKVDRAEIAINYFYIIFCSYKI